MTSETQVAVLKERKKHISDNTLIPDDYQCDLITLRDKIRDAQFEVGDIAIELVEMSAQNGLRVTNARIFEAIGRFCGKSARTVRYYYETALFYSPETRDKYSFLPFSHFVFARKMDDRWEEVLDYAAEHPNIGEPALRLHFCGVVVRGNDENAGRGNESLPEIGFPYTRDTQVPYNYVDVDASIKSGEISHDIERLAKHQKYAVISETASVLVRLQELVNHVDVDRDVIIGTTAAIDMLSEYLPRIAESIDS